MSGPRVVALVLAAGSSMRMGSENKLLARLGGVSLVARVVDALLASRADAVQVVTGHQADAVRQALADRPVTLIHNPRHAAGMGASIRAGVEGIAAATDAVLVCLADMPALRAAHVDALIDAFADAPPERICVPVHRARRGHPVLFGAAHFKALCEIEGDRGARGILAAAAAHVREIDVSDDGILLDVDTPEDLAGVGDS